MKAPVPLLDVVAPSWLPWLAALLAMVITAALLEGLVLRFMLRRDYDWKALAASLGDVVGRLFVDAWGLSIAAPIVAWAYANRLTSLPLDSPFTWAAFFLLHELAYYGYHRSAHRVRWFWATHAVHHSPNQLTLATALRLGWTGKLTGTALFFAPLIWFGYPPLAVFGLLAINLLYQFWIHNTWMPRLGPLEWVLNTPSHHRVHHASNPEYLDCNFGGVLIVYDRLFGSFVAESADVPPRYGLTTPLLSHNPIRIAFHEWINLLRDVVHAKDLTAFARALFGPPATQAAPQPSVDKT